MPFTYFSRRSIVLIALAVLALIGMGMNSPIVESVTFRSVNGSETPVEINAPYVRQANVPQEVTIALFYRGYGNTVMRFKALSCFVSSSLQLNGNEYSFPQDSRRCGDVIIDLNGALRPGINTVTLLSDDLWGKSGIAVGPVLFGANLFQTLFTALFIGSALGLVYLGLRRREFDRTACILFIDGCLYYLQWLNYQPHFFQGTNDLIGHVAHIQYVSDHFFHPYGFTGWEDEHPPMYYWVCASAAKLFALFGVFDVWTGIRLVALLSYCVFIYFGMRTGALVLRGMPFYVAAALLVFWPAGMLLYVTHINNDVLLYPLYAASFYYLLLWYRTDAIAALCKVLVFCGVGFAVKTTAITPIVIAAATIVFKLGWRNLPIVMAQKKIVLGILVLIAGILLNLGKVFYGLRRSHPLTASEYLNGAGFPSITPVLPWEPQFSIHALFERLYNGIQWFSLRDLFEHPYFMWWKSERAWDVYIKTMLFNYGHWKYPAIAICMYILVLLMCLCTVVFVVTRSRQQYRALFPLLMGYVVPPLVIISYYAVNPILPVFDFRFVYPSIIAIITLFSLAVQEAKIINRPLAYYAGNTLSGSFIVLSITLFLLQMRT